MSKATTLSKLVSQGTQLADGQITAAEVSGLAAVAVSNSFTDLSNKPTTDDVPETSGNKYYRPGRHYAFSLLFRG